MELLTAENAIRLYRALIISREMLLKYLEKLALIARIEERKN